MWAGRPGEGGSEPGAGQARSRRSRRQGRWRWRWRQVCGQQRDLFVWSSLCAAPEQDHGGLRGASLGEERAEVGVRRDDDSVLGGGALEDVSVWGQPEGSTA
jgi:hypothetical protein